MSIVNGRRAMICCAMMRPDGVACCLLDRHRPIRNLIGGTLFVVAFRFSIRARTRRVWQLFVFLAADPPATPTSPAIEWLTRPISGLGGGLGVISAARAGLIAGISMSCTTP